VNLLSAIAWTNRLGVQTMTRSYCDVEFRTSAYIHSVLSQSSSLVIEYHDPENLVIAVGILLLRSNFTLDLVENG
jgi:hypothetical protein